jgi:hypothetical protein
MARNPILYALVMGAVPLLILAVLFGASLLLALVLAILWAIAIVLIMTKLAPALQRIGNRRDRT